MNLFEKVYTFLDKQAQRFSFVFKTLLITVFLAYGLTVNMYFWKDDFALMIKAMHPEESVGFFGSGFFGDGAYRYIVVPFSLLYPFFKLNPAPYFLIGVLLYFIATISVYFLALKIFNDKTKAFLTGFIFGSGYVGADSIYGLTNSYQTSWTITILCFVLFFLIKHFRENSLRAYLISVILFYFNLDAGFIRAHGFFLIVFSGIFLLVNRFRSKELILFVVKLLPFFLIFSWFYLFSKIALNGSNNLTHSVISGEFSLLKNPVITFINVFIPLPINHFLYEFFIHLTNRQMSIEKVLMTFSSLFVLVNIFLTIFFYKKKKVFDNDLRVLVFSLASVVSSFVGIYFIGAGVTYFDSTHRYLSTALIGVSLYWVSLSSLLSRQKVAYTNIFLCLPLLVGITFLVYSNLYALENIQSRTSLQKSFFTQLKTYIPEIAGKTFIYFDVSNLNDSAGRFGGIFGAGSVGGSPEISLQYDVDRYSIITAYSSFDDFLVRYKKENGEINKSYAFYYDKGQLKDNTSLFREILAQGKDTKLDLETLGLGKEQSAVFETKLNKDLEIDSPEILIDFPENAYSLTPSILKFHLKIDPQEDLNTQGLTGQNEYLEYLISRSNYYKHAKVTEFLNYFQNNLPSNLLDQKTDTYWMADRGVWNNIIHKEDKRAQFLEIALAEPINIGGILFTNGHETRTPTQMRVLNFVNGNWVLVGEINLTGNKKSNEKWFEHTKPFLSNRVRIEITNSVSRDAPQLSEIELVDQKYSGLNFSYADQIEVDPSKLFKTKSSYELVKNYYGTNGRFYFSYYSDKDGGFVNLPVAVKVKGLGEDFEYEIPLPGQGNHWVQGKIDNLNLPAKYTFSNFEIVNPPLSFYLNNE